MGKKMSSIRKRELAHTGLKRYEIYIHHNSLHWTNFINSGSRPILPKLYFYVYETLAYMYAYPQEFWYTHGYYALDPSKIPLRPYIVDCSNAHADSWNKIPWLIRVKYTRSVKRTSISKFLYVLVPKGWIIHLSSIQTAPKCSNKRYVSYF